MNSENHEENDYGCDHSKIIQKPIIVMPNLLSSKFSKETFGLYDIICCTNSKLWLFWHIGVAINLNVQLFGILEATLNFPIIVGGRLL